MSHKEKRFADCKAFFLFSAIQNIEEQTWQAGHDGTLMQIGKQCKPVQLCQFSLVWGHPQSPGNAKGGHAAKPLNEE